MTEEKDALRNDRGALAAALRDAGAVFVRPNAIRCSFHDDRSPSGSVYRGDDGAWRFKCHGCGFCGDVFDVRAKASGRDVGDELRAVASDERHDAPKPPRVFPTVEALVESVRHWATVEDHYVYANPATRAAELIVVRCRDSAGRKTFIQASPFGVGGFAQRAAPKPWPLFNRTAMASASRVVVVEGEKCVKALREVGVVATTSPAGAENAKHADWTPLAGKADVLIWRDNDAKGLAYADDVAAALDALADPPKRVRRVEVESLELPEKGDVVDFLAAMDGEDAHDRGRAVEMVLAIAKDAHRDELTQLIEATIAGERAAVDWPWRKLSDGTQALLPGTVTCVCGDPGSTKSLLMLEACWQWHEESIPVALFELEDDRAMHLNRMLAQLQGNANLTRARWVHDNADAARAALAASLPAIRAFRRRIWDAPEKPPTLRELSEWVERRASEGSRVIVIDPITAAAAEDKQFLADQAFILGAKATARRHRCSVVIVTHPRMGKMGKALDGMSGGASYPRFAQTVLWVDRHEQPKSARLMSALGPYTGRINRSIRIAKARNGEGHGWEIGYYFDPATLRFSEQGIVLGDQPEGAYP